MHARKEPGDIPSAQNTAGQNARETELLYRTLFDQSPDGVLVIDTNGVLIAFNEAAPAQLGYSREEFARLRLSDIDAFESPEDIRRKIDEIIEKGNAEFEVTHKTKAGELRDVRVFTRVLSLSGRTVFHTVWRDITEQRRMEATLRASETKYKDLFEHANDAIFIVDAAWKYRAVNKRAVELFGYSKEEFLSMSIFDVIPSEQVPRSQEELAKLSTRGAYEKFVGKMRTKDGRWRDIEVSSSAIIEDGVVVGARDIVRDITDRKKLEEELVKAQKLEAVGLLAGGIAHDFNNLLTSVLGNISLALTYFGSSPEAAARLREAERASLMAQDLTRRLITFAAGGAPVKRAASLAGLIRAASAAAQEDDRCVFEFSLPDDLRPCEVDEGQVSQALRNIIVNAVEATPAGGRITVGGAHVRVSPSEGLSLNEGDYVRITVRDQGAGILPEHRTRIFDPFFTTKEGGSGLGLTAAYSIVRQHNGALSVESEPGVGTVVHIYLPASTAAPRNEAAAKGAAAETGRILVMDDEEIVREVASAMLRSIGYEVETARDGAEAIALYSQAKEAGRPFSALIVDLTIHGGMGGKEAVERLRALDPAVKAIVSSGYSSDPIMANHKDYGFIGVITKPYKTEELRQAVHEALKGPW